MTLPPEQPPSLDRNLTNLNQNPPQDPSVETIGQETDEIHISVELSDLEQAYESLPPHAQASVLLGRKDKHAEVLNLPPSTRIVTVSTLDPIATQEIINAENLGKVLAPHSVISMESEPATLQILTTPENARILTSKLHEKGILADISVRESDGITRIVSIHDHLSAIDPVLFKSLSDHLEGMRAQTTIKSVKPDGTVTPTPKLETPTKTDLPHPETIGTLNEETILCAQQEPKIEQAKDRLIGECPFLTVNLHQITDESILTAVTNEISHATNSRDFVVTSDNFGNIVIIGLKQRSGGRLALIAKQLHKSSENQAYLHLGLGNAEFTGGKIRISAYPSTEFLHKLDGAGKRGRKVTASSQFAREIQSGRHGTTANIETRENTALDATVDISKISPEVSLRRGEGPDELIGHKEELDSLKKFIRSPHNKLAILKGQAGSGKSRLLYELIKEDPDKFLVLSFDPTDENIPGKSMITFAQQLKHIIGKKIKTGAISPDKSNKFMNLMAFCAKDESEQLKIAIENKEEIIKICHAALTALDEEESFTLVIDDVHHIDRHSDPALMGMLDHFLEHSSSKAIMAMRPEERFESPSQRALERSVNRRGKGKTKVTYINLENEDGTPKLDIKNPNIAFDYVFHSLHQDIRTTPQGSPKNLSDNWHLDVSRRCKTPFEMTSILNVLLTDEENFIVTEDAIALSEKGQAELNNVDQAGDLQQYHLDKLAEIEPEQRVLLGCMALLGKRIPTDQISAIASRIAQIGNPEASLIELQRRRYLTKKNGNYEIWHDTFRNTIIRSLSKDAQFKNLGWQLYQLVVASGQGTDNLTLFALLQFSSESAHSDTSFVSAYCQTGKRALATAEEKSTHTATYAIARSALTSGILVDTQTAEKFKKSSPEIQSMVVQSLLTKAKASVNLGKFKETEDAIGTLETLIGEKTDVESQKILAQAYVAGFEACYISIKKQGAEAYWNKLTSINFPGIPPEERALMEQKLKFRQAAGNSKKLAEVHPLTAHRELQYSNQLLVERFKRLEERVRLEEIRNKLLEEGNDGDTYMEPSMLSEDDRQRFLAQKKELSQLDATRREHPHLFSPIEELFLLDLLGQTCSFLGHYVEAKSCFSETWRLSNQMQIPREGGRAAKLKGDILMMEAIGDIQACNDAAHGSARPRNSRHFLRSKIKEAITTYSHEGINYIEDTDPKNAYNLLLRVQRVRAIGTLCVTYGHETDVAKIDRDLREYLDIANEDLQFLLKEKYPAENMKNMKEEEIADVSYYLSSFAGHILQIQQKLKLPIAPEILNHPLLSGKSLQLGQGFAKKSVDHCGEVQRKIDGLTALSQLHQPNS